MNELSIEDVQQLLGARDLEIFTLQKKLYTLAKEVQRLTPPPETRVPALTEPPTDPPA